MTKRRRCRRHCGELRESEELHYRTETHDRGLSTKYLRPLVGLHRLVPECLDRERCLARFLINPELNQPRRVWSMPLGGPVATPFYADELPLAKEG